MYGVGIGRAFFGESMFTRVTDASKVALVHAIDFLRARGTAVLDCQVASAHTQSLGAVDIPREGFLRLIAEYAPTAPPPQTLEFRLSAAVCCACSACATMRRPKWAPNCCLMAKKKQSKWKVR